MDSNDVNQELVLHSTNLTYSDGTINKIRTTATAYETTVSASCNTAISDFVLSVASTDRFLTSGGYILLSYGGDIVECTYGGVSLTSSELTQCNRLFSSSRTVYPIGSIVTILIDQSFGGPFGTSAFQEWLYLDGITNFSLAQTLDGSSQFSGSRIRIPMTYTQLTTNSNANMNDFSSACDITVSFQGATEIDGIYYPDGANNGSAITIPMNIINSMQSDEWADGNEFIAGPFAPLTNSFVPTLTLLSTLSLSADIAFSSVTTSGLPTGTISVGDVSNLPLDSGNVYIVDGGNAVTISYTSLDTVNNYLLGCEYEFGVTATYSAGASLFLTIAATAQYISTEQYVIVVNTVTSNSTNQNNASTDETTATINNYVYYAQYTNGSIGQWLQGQPLPEFGVSMAFAPSSSTLFAVGPSGVVYSSSFSLQTSTTSNTATSSQTVQVGTWQTSTLTQVIDTIDQTFLLPAFNSAASDVVPTLTVFTIDATDYLFIFGGIANGMQQFIGYYMQLDDSGTPYDVQFTPTLPIATSQGTLTQTAGLYSFTTSSAVYVRDTTSLTVLSLYCIAAWIDGTGTFQVGAWTNVISQYSNPLFNGNVQQQLNNTEIVIGVAFNNIITNTSILALTASGCCVSDNPISLPVFYSGISTYATIANAAVFENDDGTISLLSSYNFGTTLYPVTWIDVPTFGQLGHINAQFLVITATGSPMTNFAVSFPTQQNTMYVLGATEEVVENYVFPSVLIQTSNGWEQVNTGTVDTPMYDSMLCFTLYGDAQPSFPTTIGFFEDNGCRWSLVKYCNHNDVLLSIADVTYTSYGSLLGSNSIASSFTVCEYDGLAGLNQQPQNILTTAIEIA